MRSMAGCLRQWRSANRGHNESVTTLSRMQRWREMRAVRTWREVVAEMLHESEVLHNVAQTWRQMELAAGWRRWQEVASDLQAVDVILGRAVTLWKGMHCRF